MNALKRMMSFVTSARTEEASDAALPRCVQRMYVQEKDAGHRGPVIGAFLVAESGERELVVSVTPTGVVAVSSESGAVLSTYRPAVGDAFTAALLVSKQTESELGLMVGTQNGKLVLLQFSSEESSLRVVAQCFVTEHAETREHGISCLASVRGATTLALVGTVSGKILIWDPVLHPLIPSVSVTTISSRPSSITCLISTQNGEVWASSEGIHVFSLQLGDNLISMTPKLSAPIQFEGMHVVTNMVDSSFHDLVICLSSCSEVYLIDKSTHQLAQRYPASLMTCGVAMTSLNGLELDSVPGSTFLQLGGVDGSLCLRELTKRARDGKLQCVLLKFFQTLKPGMKKIQGTENFIGASDGCPITSLASAADVCVVGDAACCVYIVKLNLDGLRVVPDDDSEQIHRENTREPSLTTEKRDSTDSFVPAADGEIELPFDEVQRQVTSIRTVERGEGLGEVTHAESVIQPEVFDQQVRKEVEHTHHSEPAPEEVEQTHQAETAPEQVEQTHHSEPACEEVKQTHPS